MDYSQQKSVNKGLTVDERIGFLKYCAEKYETDGTSPIIDSSYDEEYAELELLSPDDPFFDEVGGLEENIHGEKVNHDIVMGSLIKTKMVNVNKWIVNNFKDVNSLVFSLSHKLDGLSLSLVYRDGKLVRAVTRGNGSIGVNVTGNALCVRGVKETISCMDEIEVRGEILKFRDDFKARWSKDYSNERNFSTGTMGLLADRRSEVIDRQLDFIAYEEVKKSYATEREKLEFINGLGFQTLKSVTKFTKAGLTADQIERAIVVYMDMVGKERANLPYLIDGIVVKCNDIQLAKSLGSVSNGRKQKSSAALKFPPVEKETKVIDVISETGKSGQSTPVAILEPIDLDGSIVQRATMHNWGMFLGQDALRIGAKVIIVKRGDIIPYLQKVVDNTGIVVKIPTHCACGNELKWTDTKVNLMCDNPLCIAQIGKRIDYYFKTIGVKGIGFGILSKLTDVNELKWDEKAIISSISEMYYMLDNDRKTEHPFRKYNHLKEYFGNKTYENILKSVNAVKEVPLNVFVESLSIGRIGSMSKDLTDIAPSIEEIDKLTVEDIMKIPGFGDIKANSFVNGWKEMRGEIGRILKHITIKQTVKASDKLIGKKFCFTGSFSRPRTDLEKMVVENGGKCSSVGKEVILCWDGEIQGGKLEKSQKLGLSIISEDDFMRMLA